MTSNSANRPFSAVLAGGGSAGHVSPMLAIAVALTELAPESKLLAVGSKDGLETRLVPAAGLELAFIDRVPMPRRPNLAALKFPLRMRRAIADSTRILREAKADVVLGVGGYICTPMYIAAHRAGIPIVIHEANIKPGLANRLGARYAKTIGTAFAETVLRDSTWVGMPMREQVAHLDRAANKTAARAALGLAQDRPTLIVTGGSLGAVRINNAVVNAIPAITAAGIQILHITGGGKSVLDAAGVPVSAPGYRQVEYVDGMEQAYAAADLLICRSGAGTVSEVAATGTPALFVPLPVGNGEQALNAQTLVGKGAALVVADNDFNGSWLASYVVELLADPQRLIALGTKAYQSGIRDAASKMALAVKEAAEATQ
ncbi:UDP-N-acetylglucosamine--N-acetylmuramyl-(pentapeptide) pyrophosphoryl-undecaprenol N-acetylglucosamine transferase [Renibacterium salmoninarum ATCC 33209]|uniref:UDP-N-acetylglucosamine--N-acetylmuramyl-(pentapeptide) pyrophosphoryl-undecaprenol N-acetylglucosamine transferase n=1 Tax=Renibacterium salmoninarum (strain ATCC 33209 / DSM 20767 / JCM 11484 / NBRC 15589 / NCIMB 2235) TaxID=288705 RepID=A9WRD8_RENSM|nr:undecaprenyldiphospho-muramoylpentapeptide beta-N-acetylglucosaminyltransferase [Renibacterium salmoninarum]ABY24220.1 UDP-N-acetylglucosamine--N-acetylmuramyl-(pentapeptide) pyrophosphoryl-undecaprenol N-acetylglucosamine transferase [Renibacterium salmoninarum ATCC 33209]